MTQYTPQHRSQTPKIISLLRLTISLQVYGGGVSFVVHPYMWSSSPFLGSSSISTDCTSIARLSAIFTNCTFSGGRALSRTMSGFFYAFHMYCCCIHVFAHFFTFVADNGPIAGEAGTLVAASGSDVSVLATATRARDTHAGDWRRICCCGGYLYHEQPRPIRFL